MTLLQTARPVILVISPMPAMPTSAGNRRRLVATCEFLKSAGFDIDFAYVAHEDQIYRRFNQTPPTDLLTMVGYFRHLYLIELAEPVRLKTGANGFDIDDWCPPEVDSFVLSYFAASPGTKAILVNYVWLSRALEAAPNTVLKLIDTHDRFAGRKAQYQPFRAEANFFHTNEVGEARGLLRADIAIAIQAQEQTYFTEIMGRQAALLLPNVREMRTFKPPEKLESIGFLGHGNDANLHSIGRFAALWAQRWQQGSPSLVIAGEICRSLPAHMGDGIRLMGYVANIDEFFDEIDLFVAPILMGTGLKMKVLEALSYGTPVIGTQLAFEGIDTEIDDHLLTDLNDMIGRIEILRENTTALAQLTVASEYVFRQYCDKARQRAVTLARQINEKVGSDLTAHSMGLLLGPEQQLADTLVSDCSDGGTLIATEFRPYTNADPTSATPFRRRWFVVNDDHEKATLGKSVAGRRVSLAPLITRVPATSEEKQLSLKAMEILSGAAADWHSIVESATVVGRTIRLEFSGPAFLLNPSTPLRVFALDIHGCSQEIAPSALLHSNRGGHGVTYVPKLTPRCGDTAILSLCLSGQWEDYNISEIDTIIVVGHSLMGRIDMVDAAGDSPQ